MSSQSFAELGVSEVVVRALSECDRDTPFAPIYSLITACQANGFRKFDLKAMTGE